MKLEQLIAMIERGMLPSNRLDELNTVLRKKGDAAYRLLGAIDSYSDAPFNAETKSITAELLRERDDPMLAGRALHVLVGAWGLHAEYRSEILSAIKGLDWDDTSDYKLAAVFCAGFFLSKTMDKEILEAVLERLQDSTELGGTREAARDAILRAMGKDSKELVRMSVRLDSSYIANEDEPVVWARRQLQA